MLHSILSVVLLRPYEAIQLPFEGRDHRFTTTAIQESERAGVLLPSFRGPPCGPTWFPKRSRSREPCPLSPRARLPSCSAPEETPALPNTRGTRSCLVGQGCTACCKSSTPTCQYKNAVRSGGDVLINSSIAFGKFGTIHRGWQQIGRAPVRTQAQIGSSSSKFTVCTGVVLLWIARCVVDHNALVRGERGWAVSVHLRA